MMIDPNDPYDPDEYWNHEDNWEDEDWDWEYDNFDEWWLEDQDEY